MGTENKTFDDATNACKELGGFLAEPRSEEINTAVKYFDFKYKQFWIGLRDNLKDRNFHWQTDQSALSYTDWGKNQPNNHGGSQYCVMIDKKYTWNDRACSAKFEYLCQANKREYSFTTRYCVRFLYQKLINLLKYL